MPPRSRELHARHLPDVPPFPHPDDEELEATPQPTDALTRTRASSVGGNENLEVPSVMDAMMAQTCNRLQESLDRRVQELERGQQEESQR